MRRSGRSNVVPWRTSKAFGVRSLAAVEPTAFPFCALRLAMPFATLSEAQIIYRRQRRKQRPSFARTENPSLSSLPSVEFSASQREFLQKTAKEIKVGI